MARATIIKETQPLGTGKKEKPEGATTTYKPKPGLPGT